MTLTIQQKLVAMGGVIVIAVAIILLQSIHNASKIIGKNLR